MKSPTVSVILPVYNGAATLRSALQSLSSQVFASSEIIAINDGSSDGSAAILESFDDPRLVVIHQENRGLAATLNRGLELARADLVARLDQDDLCLPDRFSRQVAFLADHPAVALLGTWAQIYEGDRATERFHRHATSTDTLRLELLFDNPFVHSSVMLRTSVARELGGYTVAPGRGYPEDYDFWSRIASLYPVANLPEVLTVYREVPNSITRTVPDRILANVVEVSTRNLVALLGRTYPEQELRSLSSLYHGRPSPSRLPGPRLRTLLGEAARLLAGESSGWSEEFRRSLSHIDRRIQSRRLGQALPPSLAGIVRSAVRAVRG